jgi:RNA polymerase sigma-70 factor (ECF subfamily)
MLVAGAKRGDVEAFTLLYRHFVARVYDYVARRVDSRHSAEEVTQEIFYRAYRDIAGCRDDHAFAGWLFAIVRNSVADAHRSGRSQAEPLDASYEIEDPDPTPEQIALARDQARLLAEARARCLTGRDRDLLDLHLAGLTDQEIATAQGRGYGAVRTAHWRLINRLRECFQRLNHEQGVRHVAP